MILVKIGSNRNQKMFNFSKSIKIELVSFLKDRTEIENFEIDPALLSSNQGCLRGLHHDVLLQRTNARQPLAGSPIITQIGGSACQYLSGEVYYGIVACFAYPSLYPGSFLPNLRQISLLKFFSSQFISTTRQDKEQERYVHENQVCQKIIRRRKPA